MNMSKSLLPVMIVAAGLSGCANSNTGTGEVIGTLGGAALGGLVGAQFGDGSGQLIAGIVGAGLGAYLGNQIGSKLDDADRQKAQTAMNDSLEYSADGRQTSWQNPNSGNSGQVTPTRTYYASDNRPCREFVHMVEIEGEIEEVRGTACRNPDGEWVVE